MIQQRPSSTIRSAGRGFVAIAVAAGLGFGVSACGNSSSGGGGFNGDITLSVENPDRCDPLDPRHCLFPFPNDHFTVEDGGTDTGRRVNLARESMPTNKDGVKVDSTEWNRNDGFSPGAQIATWVEGIDLPASGIVDSGNVGGSLAADSPIVLLDVDTGERKPYWAELDASVSGGPSVQALFVRPAVNLLEGHRHIVALRGLKRADGSAIEAGDVFRAYRDRLRSNVPEVEARRDHMEQIFAELEKDGVERGDLYLAWDFTVASERNLTERMLHIRDDAFAALGSAAPAFTVTQVEENVDEFVRRRVTGTFEVPNYMTGAGEPGSRFNNGADGLPQRNGSFTAGFICVIPHAAFDAADAAVPARPAVYGHGLLGSNDEVSAGNIRRMTNEHNFVYCATKWLGMSEDDVLNAINILNDLSKFPTLADRTQQGFLDFLFLGRLMIHAGGLVSDPAFQDASGAGLIDRGELYYDGNSQGGIMGGAVTAVAIDWTRAVLGVPAMNYSTLLQRSVDWDAYRLIYDPAYPDEIERGLGLILIQMLWDRGEANGYAHHLTDDPLPGTPAHKVLMHIAFGDHQVSPDAADVEARTIGARIHTPVVVDGRLPDHVTPYWGIEPIGSYPYDGSAIIVWDSGAPVPPLVNLPPRTGQDPHGHPRNDVNARIQKSEFLKPNGAVVDVCGGAPCMAPQN